MLHLLCVDETGIETNPICSEARFSTPLSFPTSARALKQCGGLQLQGADPEKKIREGM